MTAIRKFLFDVDFEHHPTPSRTKNEAKEKDGEGEEQEQEAEEIIVPTFSEEDLAEARQSGFDAGRQEGIREAASAIEREIADALNTITGHLSEVSEKQRQDMDDTQASALRLVHALTTKFFPRMAETAGVGEIEGMATSLLERLRGEPRIVFVVGESISGELEGRLAGIATSQGFDGRIEVIGDASLTAGDCRIEWSTGGAERSMKDLLAEIDSIIAGNMDTPLDMAPLFADELATEPGAEVEETGAPAAAAEGAPDEETRAHELNGEQADQAPDDPDGPAGGGDVDPADGDDGPLRTE